MRILIGKTQGVLVLAATFLAAFAWSVLAENSAGTTGQFGGAHERYFALTLGNRAEKESSGTILNRYGVPFTEGILPLRPSGSAEVSVGGQTKRIFILGMTDAKEAPAQDSSLHSGSAASATPIYGWADPRDNSFRFFIGDELGRIRLNYADGTTQIYPLLLGEGVWWGYASFDFQEPFPSDPRLRQAFAGALRLYPPAPLEDGNYLAVIVPRAVPIRSITIENSTEKKGTLIIKGITVETSEAGGVAGGTALTSLLRN